MPCAKPWNLPAISMCLLRKQEPHDFEIRWHLMCQGPEPDPKGFRKFIEGMRMVKDGWIWGPSDDTLQPRSLLQRLCQLVCANPGAGVIVFSQLRSRRENCPWLGRPWPADHEPVLRARPENMRPCRVDSTQCFFKKEFIGDRVFDFDRYRFEADGNFIMQLYQESPHRFVFCDEILTWFNSLEWGDVPK